MGTDLEALDVELQFWSLVYSDEQLLQAEFAALVADIEIPPRAGRCRRRASGPASDELADIWHRDIRVRRVTHLGHRVHGCGRSPPGCGISRHTSGTPGARRSSMAEQAANGCETQLASVSADLVARFDMEHRQDLEDLLLSGLPPVEQQHVAQTMREATAAKLRRKRAQREPVFNEGEEELVDS